MSEARSTPSESWSAAIGGVRVHYGGGRLAEIGEIAGRWASRRVLVITDPGVRSAGHLDAASRALENAQLEVEVFDAVSSNPTDREVTAGALFASTVAPELIVGLGGGSAMDVAKGVNFVLAGGGRIADYEGYGKARGTLLPSLGVPTTAGTGSDAQSYALVSDAESHRKMACGDRGIRFREVILDPQLTLTAPPEVTAAAGLDAVSHAVESHVSRASNPVSKLFSGAAWRLLDGALEECFGASPGAGARGRALLGAHFAGAAIEQSMLGAAHATANPLTAAHGVVHGIAVAIMLPHVVELNADCAADGYVDLDPSGAHSLALRLTKLREAGALPSKLRECGVERSNLDRLARDAATQWTGRYNPRPVDYDDLRRLYDAAW